MLIAGLGRLTLPELYMLSPLAGCWLRTCMTIHHRCYLPWQLQPVQSLLGACRLKTMLISRCRAAGTIPICCFELVEQYRYSLNCLDEESNRQV